MSEHSSTRQAVIRKDSIRAYSAGNSAARREIFAELGVMAREKMSPTQAELFIQFIDHLYATASYEDLTTHSRTDLFAASVSFWNEVYYRKPGEVKLRVFNPQIETVGWQSKHTIVELVQDDMPFLVDSLLMELNRREITVHTIYNTGAFKVVRDKENKITQIYPMGTDEATASNEALIFIEIDLISDEAILADLKESFYRILHDVRLCVEDWQKVMDKVDETIHILEKLPVAAANKAALTESIEFLRWLTNNHFTFLGWREYKLVKEEGDDWVLKPIAGTGLGVLREFDVNKISRQFSKLPPQAKNIILDKNIYIESLKTNRLATVHRHAYTDQIEIKVFDDAGNVVGIRRIIGLYTSVAYNSRPYAIPLLRQKVRAVMQDSRLSPSGHAGKALLNILETLPRDDLFQSSPEELLELGLGILQMQERRRISLFVRRDIFNRFMSCLLFIPSDRYTTELGEAATAILMKAFNGLEVYQTTVFSESILARIHFLIRIDRNEPLNYDITEIEEKLKQISRNWQDDLYEELIDYFGETEGSYYFTRYKKAFSASYVESFTPRVAAYDISHLEKLSAENTLEMSFSKPLEGENAQYKFKLYHLDTPIPLSDALPILENMGLRVLTEQPYGIHISKERVLWINDFAMTTYSAHEVHIDEVRDLFQETFEKVWFNEAENDGFNRLALLANLSWREISMLRAYAKYLKQINFTFTQAYIEETFSKYPNIARELVTLFKLRFDPNRQGGSQEVCSALDKRIDALLAEVDNLDEDKILRRFREIIMATLRTNFFLKDDKDQYKEYISFKLDAMNISDMPLPRPLFEIFVYAPRFEGVHLRSGKVARGGLRWSDRREDFRTEVLGLMKAQRVKNSVIVPTGAKGGFVLKQLPKNASREVIQEEGVVCYKKYISALLDLTDNRVEGEIVTNKDLIHYDEPDSYLVVAADKGTATFSDYANEVALQNNFWLGDAFASGGKTGYDHKKMGITARGAWESVKRHFREMNWNIQTTPFTVMGIGDMAGDVFGNGMLLSQQIRLVGAFNHAHIFLDPNPDAALSFNERKRLFELPRSTWADYNPDLISKGGGVFSRNVKSIQLSPEIKALLGTDKDALEPNQLIHTMLKAEVDLLWNGGIGTYIKASTESHADVGDKANDALRINGCEVRAKVVGEGGNLGVTQRGRIEYALAGGRIVTDFIDNSAGVDCSDHEVNIKILLNQVVANGDLTEKQRNELLASMTDEVGKLVLRNNYTQTQAVSLAQGQTKSSLDLFIQVMEDLERVGLLDRALEFLPTDKELQERKAAGKGLTSPELAVLLAYFKIFLKEELLKSSTPEDPYVSKFVKFEFPATLHERFYEEIIRHSLYREIIVTQLCDKIIDYMGITFVTRLRTQTGATYSDIVKAFVIVKDIFSVDNLWKQIEEMDYKVPATMQHDMLLAVARFMRRAIRWVLRNCGNLDKVEAIIQQYQPSVEKLSIDYSAYFKGLTSEVYEDAVQKYIDHEVSALPARHLSSIHALLPMLDIIDIAVADNLKTNKVAEIYFIISDELELAWLQELVLSYREETQWDALAKAALRDDIDILHRDLARNILHDPASKTKSGMALYEDWKTQYQPVIDRWKQTMLDLRSSNVIEFVMFTVVCRELKDLVQTSGR